MIDHGALNEVLILFMVAVAVVAGCLRLKLPPILGYLVIGVLMGPYGLKLVDDTEGIRAIAEFGVVFLLFTIGLEFSLPQLIRMKGAVLGLGGAQVILTTSAVAVVAIYLGFSFEAALVLGGIIAMSSTALVIKQLTDQVELHSRHGRNTVGILLFQDVMVIPFLILVSGGSSDPQSAEVLLAFAKGVFAVMLILALGHWVLRPLFHFVARFRSMELFTLTALMITLGAASITANLGLSLALGAFVAGMMLGETEFRHQIEAEIRPFRDILLGLFFITVGMLFNIEVVPLYWQWVLLTLMGLLIFKLLLITVLCRIAGWNFSVALRTGLVLAHGGEFGFAILTIAIAQEMFAPAHGQVILAALLLSMAIAPIAIRFNGQLAAWLTPKANTESRHSLQDKVEETAHELSDHVIICGYGRIGQNIARMLREEDFKYIAMELDPVLVQNAVKAQEPVTYGDAANMELLRAAGLERAAAVVLSADDTHTALKVLNNIKQAGIDIPTLVRTSDDTHLQELTEAGASEVVPETLEASLMLSSHLLMMLKVPPSKVIHKIRDVRKGRYETFRQLYPGEEVATAAWVDSEEQLRAVELTDESWAAKHLIGELNLEKYGVKLVALLHEGKRISQPDEATCLCGSDTLIMSGIPSALDLAEESLVTRIRGA